MALLRVGVYDTEAEMGAITTEAGEIFNPVIGLARGASRSIGCSHPIARRNAQSLSRGLTLCH